MFLRGLLVFGLAVAFPVEARADSHADARLDQLIREERYSEAFGEAVSALRAHLAHKGERDVETLTALDRVGVIAHLAGDQSTAEDVLGAVFVARSAVLAPGDPATVETLIHWGRAARYRNERANARGHYDLAARLVAAMPNPPAELRAQLAQAEADWQRGADLLKAIAWYREALAIRRAARATPDFAEVDNLTWLAWTLNRAGQRTEARLLATEAKAQLLRLGLASHSLRATVDNLLAENLAIDGKLTAAVPLFRATAATAEAAQRLGTRYALDLEDFHSGEIDGRDGLTHELATHIESNVLQRATFLTAATRLINQRGYRGASVDKISQQLNVTKGSFYHHHETKEELIGACF
jgi:tetratricopeptide (TPR) repeat protein